MKITVIGCGVIGSMFARHLAKGNQLVLCDPHAEKRDALASELKARGTSDISQAVRGAEIVLLAVKPGDLMAIAKAVEGESLSGQKWISVLAGATLSSLYDAIQEVDWIRAMPNVALRVNEGVLGIVETEGLDRGLMQRLFGEMGILSFFPEKQMDGFTALVGSGPAFVLVFLESLIESGILVGLSADQARSYGVQLLKAAAALVSEKGQHPDEIKLSITSAGGTTIAGLRKLEEHGLRSAVMEAVYAAYAKSKEL